jgi:electron transport complex protein RnfC
MFEEAADRFLFHCIECGICAYVCPEKRPMLHLMRYGKRELSLA